MDFILNNTDTILGVVLLVSIVVATSCLISVVLEKKE